MFCCSARQQKKKLPKSVVVGDKENSSPQKRITSTEEDLKVQVAFPEPQSTKPAPVEALKAKTKKVRWWYQLLGHKKKNTHQAPESEDVGQKVILPSSATEKSVIGDEDGTKPEAKEILITVPVAPAKVKKTRWWHRFIGRKKKNKHLTLETRDVAEEPVATETDKEAEEPNLPSSVKEESDETIQESEGSEADVPQASPTSDSSPSVATETDEEAEEPNQPSSVKEESDETIQESEGSEADVAEVSPTPDSPASVATETDKEAEEPNQPSSVKEESDDRSEESECVKDVQEASFVPKTQDSLSKEKDLAVDDGSDDNGFEDGGTGVLYGSYSPTIAPWTRGLTGHGGGVKGAKTGRSVARARHQFASRCRRPSRDELVCLGFPNLSQTCYMNSTLQGLLTLTSFVQEVHKQEKVWSSHILNQIFRGFVEVGVCHFSGGRTEKELVLTAFKNSVSDTYFEFADDGQKDAHEFLSCVLNLMKFLSADLHTAAFNMGLSYTCPVEAHIGFKMSSTRICKGCNLQSLREEDYINLSLDLVPGGSVSQSVEDYLKARNLEYHCDCGCKESSQQWSFLTLPNVLILQLQRFRITSSYTLMKVETPVFLARELDLQSSNAEQTHYSLVSIISHLGFTASSGHYICDGVSRQQTPGDRTDCWLTYNDMHVSETTVESVCSQRRQSAYILFYEKQM